MEPSPVDSLERRARKARRDREATKMSNRQKWDSGRNFVHATYMGPKPGDFPVGSLQSRAAARAMVAFHQEVVRKEEEDALAIFTPSERASVQAGMEGIDNPLVRICMIQLTRIARERGLVYEQPHRFPTPEEVRHNLAVHEEIQRLNDGNSSLIQTSHRMRESELLAIAEENLRGKKK
jgi:hypothetical protein